MDIVGKIFLEDIIDKYLRSRGLKKYNIIPSIKGYAIQSFCINRFNNNNDYIKFEWSKLVPQGHYNLNILIQSGDKDVETRDVIIPRIMLVEERDKVIAQIMNVLRAIWKC